MDFVTLGIFGLSTEASEGTAVETCTVIELVLAVTQSGVTLLIKYLVRGLDTKSTLFAFITRSADTLGTMQTYTIGFTVRSTVGLCAAVWTRESNMAVTLAIQAGTVPFTISRAADRARQGAVVTTMTRKTQTLHVLTDTKIAAVVSTTWKTAFY
jgi:hypothetical protein